MYRVIWYNELNKELAQLVAGEQPQAQQKIRATISRQHFRPGTLFRLHCPDSDRESLESFIKDEMASAAAMVPSTLEP
jgi:hypothetical protein